MNTLMKNSTFFKIDAKSVLLREKIPKVPTRFELVISCLLGRRFNQLSHGTLLLWIIFNIKIIM